jgi:hypothetical protein
MATAEWIVARELWCGRAGWEARLLERRVYPAEILPDAVGYRVTARRCDRDVACNLAGFPCRWAFTRPEFDPFELA